MIILKTRYNLKIGKFGAYFYDLKNNIELDLNQVLELLNKLNQYQEYVNDMISICKHELNNKGKTPLELNQYNHDLKLYNSIKKEMEKET